MNALSLSLSSVGKTSPELDLSFFGNFETLPTDKCDNHIMILTANSVGLKSLENIHLYANLVQIFVGNNSLVHLPEDLFQLKNLETLHLEHNKLEILPEKIGNLVNLVDLDISNNCLKSLPSSLSSLTQLSQFKVEGNPLNEIFLPQSVLQKGGTKLLRLLSAVQKGVDSKVNLFLFGPRKSGKSLLVERLCSIKKTPARKSRILSSSLQINQFQELLDPLLAIKNWTHQKTSFITWDFSGNDEYSGTHEHFILPLAIYVLVFDISLPLVLNKPYLIFWLNQIRLSAPQAPIFLVGTHIDSRICKMDYALKYLQGLKESFDPKYSPIVQYTCVSSRSLDGIEDLRQSIYTVSQQPELSGYHAKNPFYTLVELELDYLRSKGNCSLMACEFHKILDEAGFSGIEQRTIIRHLLDTGQVRLLNSFNPKKEFHKETRGVVILNLEWLNKWLIPFLQTENFNLPESWTKNPFGRSSFVTILSVLLKQLVSGKVGEKEIMFALEVARSFGVLSRIKTGLSGTTDLNDLYIPSLLNECNLSDREKDDLLRLPPFSSSALSPPLSPRSPSLSPRSRISLPHPHSPPISPHSPRIRSLGPSVVPQSTQPEPLISCPESVVSLSSTESSEYLFPIIRYYEFDMLSDSQWWGTLVWSLKMFDKFSWKLTSSSRNFLCMTKSPAKIFFERVNPSALMFHYLGLVPSDYNVITTVEVYLTTRHKGNIHISVPCPTCFKQRSPVHLFSNEELELSIIRNQTTAFCDRTNQIFQLREVLPEQFSQEQPNVHFLEFSQLENLKYLSEGSFSTVFSGTINNISVAIKQLNDCNNNSTTYDDFRKEARFLSLLQHPNIVELIGICLEPTAFVLELCEDDLYSRIHENKKYLSLRNKVHFMLGIARAMKYLHSFVPPIIHRDLKSPNVLISRCGHDLVAKISDFGLAETLVSKISKQVIDCPMWSAPEMIGKEGYDEKVDVYSFGVICYEILTRTLYFGDIKFWTVVEKRIFQGERPLLTVDLCCQKTQPLPVAELEASPFSSTPVALSEPPTESTEEPTKPSTSTEAVPPETSTLPSITQTISASWTSNPEPSPGALSLSSECSPDLSISSPPSNPVPYATSNIPPDTSNPLSLSTTSLDCFPTQSRLQIPSSSLPMPESSPDSALSSSPSPPTSSPSLASPLLSPSLSPFLNSTPSASEPCVSPNQIRKRVPTSQGPICIPTLPISQITKGPPSSIPRTEVTLPTPRESSSINVSEPEPLKSVNGVSLRTKPQRRTLSFSDIRVAHLDSLNYGGESLGTFENEENTPLLTPEASKRRGIPKSILHTMDFTPHQQQKSYIASPSHPPLTPSFHSESDAYLKSIVAAASASATSVATTALSPSIDPVRLRRKSTPIKPILERRSEDPPLERKHHRAETSPSRLSPPRFGSKVTPRSRSNSRPRSDLMKSSGSVLEFSRKRHSAQRGSLSPPNEVEKDPSIQEMDVIKRAHIQHQLKQQRMKEREQRQQQKQKQQAVDQAVDHSVGTEEDDFENPNSVAKRFLPQLIELVRRSWAQDPKQRPTFVEIESAMSSIYSAILVQVAFENPTALTGGIQLSSYHSESTPFPRSPRMVLLSSPQSPTASPPPSTTLSPEKTRSPSLSPPLSPPLSPMPQRSRSGTQNTPVNNDTDRSDSKFESPLKETTFNLLPQSPPSSPFPPSSPPLSPSSISPRVSSPQLSPPSSTPNMRTTRLATGSSLSQSSDNLLRRTSRKTRLISDRETFLRELHNGTSSLPNIEARPRLTAVTE